MSIVTMDISSFEIERNDPLATADECADWTPAPALQHYSRQPDALPVNLILSDTETFLNRMYAYQHV